MMSRYPVSLWAMFSSAWRNRDLIRQLVWRDVLGRYRGSFGGLLWSLLNPLAMLGVYTFVFGYVFPSRWQHRADGPQDFAVILFAGLIVVNFFSECVNLSSKLIAGNANYVKKAIFPLEVLPWALVGSALFHSAVSFSILLLMSMGIHHHFEPAALLLPVLFSPFALLVTGLCWFIAGTSVYVRDIGNAVPLLMTALMFLSPVFYSLEAVPEPVRAYFYLNPMTFIILQARGLLFGGSGIDWMGWTVYMAAGSLTAWAGFAVFQNLRKEFSDAL